MKSEMIIKLTNDDGKVIILSEHDENKIVTIETERLIYKNWILYDLEKEYLTLRESGGLTADKESIYYSKIMSIKFNE